ELISALPGLVAQELESDGNVVEGILVRERLPRPAPRHKIQTRRTLLLLLIGNELPSIIQIAQGIGLRDEFLVGAEAVHQSQTYEQPKVFLRIRRDAIEGGLLNAVVEEAKSTFRLLRRCRVGFRPYRPIFERDDQPLIYSNHD